MPMNQRPFAFFPMPPERTTAKPRMKGLTMVMDWGMPIRLQEDWMRLNAPYVDLMKIVVGTARLYDTTYLKKKLDLYKSCEIAPFLGGQFLEYVLHAQGIAAVGPYCDEAKRLGVHAIEVSDNLVTLTPEERQTVIRTAIDCGLEVYGEVGSKFTSSDGDLLITQAQHCLQAGARIVLIEGAELLRHGSPDLQLCRRLRTGLDIDRIMFELGGPWIPETTVWSTYALRLFLIQTFGPDVNLANIMPDLLLDTEATRVGLGDPLLSPEDMAAQSALRT